MKKIEADIKNETFERVYLLYGEETYLRDSCRRRLTDAVAASSDSMNRTIYSGRDIRESEVIDQAETLPFFADRRLILIRDSGFFKGAAEVLAAYMAELPPYLTIVFSENEVDKRSRLFKAVQKSGYICEFKPQTEETLSAWIVRYLDREGRRITRDALAEFMARMGSDMGRIERELNKLTAYTEGRGMITVRDVEALTPQELENRVFDMVSAVAEHKKERALALYADLLALKEPPMRIMILIGRQYRQLYLISEMKREGEADTVIAPKLGIPPFAARRLSGLSRSYRREALRRAVNLCAAFEEDTKNGRITDRLAVELLLNALAG